MLEGVVTGKRCTLALVCAAGGLIVARAWPAPVVHEARPEPVTYHYVPLSGSLLWDVVDDADGDYDADGNPIGPAQPAPSCLPFLAPIVERAGWQLQIARGHSGCTGDNLVASYAVRADGSVDWHQPEMPTRHLGLSASELAAIRGLDRLDCVRTEQIGYGEGWYRISIGDHVMAPSGALISHSSTMAAKLDAIFEGALARYRAGRLAAFGPIDLRLTTVDESAERRVAYTVRIVDHQLTVRRGRKLLLEQTVEPAQLVDLVDWLLAPADPLDPELVTTRGVLYLHGRSIPLSLSSWIRGPARLIESAVYEAQSLSRS